MQPIFYQSPASYRAESMRISRHWWITLPFVVTIALCVFAVIDKQTYGDYLQREGGILETLHSVLAFASAAVAARILLIREVRADPLIAVWLAVFVVGGIYLGGEEASWGQHYFHWQTPEEWAAINRQEETNLHNTSIWLDHVPRVTITLAIFVGGMLVPWMKLAGSRLLWKRMDFVYPPLALISLAVLLLLGVLEDAVEASTDVLDNVFAFSSGEMQENFIIGFVFFYLLFLRRRALDIRSGAHVPEMRAPATDDSRPAARL
jgi:hypothetical protein